MNDGGVPFLSLCRPCGVARSPVGRQTFGQHHRTRVTAAHLTNAPDRTGRDVLLRWPPALEYATLAWNAAER